MKLLQCLSQRRTSWRDLLFHQQYPTRTCGRGNAAVWSSWTM